MQTLSPSGPRFVLNKCSRKILLGNHQAPKGLFTCKFVETRPVLRNPCLVIVVFTLFSGKRLGLGWRILRAQGVFSSGYESTFKTLEPKASRVRVCYENLGYRGFVCLTPCNTVVII